MNGEEGCFKEYIYGVFWGRNKRLGTLLRMPSQNYKQVIICGNISSCIHGAVRMICIVSVILMCHADD